MKKTSKIVSILIAFLMLFVSCQQSASGETSSAGNGGSGTDASSTGTSNGTANDYDLGISGLNSGWDSEFDSSTSTITFGEAWSAKGWWLDSFDGSDYESVYITFETSETKIKLGIEYNNSDTITEKFADVGSTSISADLDSSLKNSIKQIYLQSESSGLLKLKSAVLKRVNSTSSSDDGTFNGSSEDDDSDDTEDSDDSDDTNDNVTSLSVPTNFRISSYTSNSVSLTWDSVEGAKKYEITYGTKPTYEYNSTYTSAKTSPKTISDLKANTSYYFWIKAIAGDVESDVSSAIVCTTSAESSAGSGSGSGSGNSQSYALNDLVHGESVGWSDSYVTQGVSISLGADNKSIVFQFKIDNSDEELKKLWLYKSSDRDNLESYTSVTSKTVNSSTVTVKLDDPNYDFTDPSEHYYIIVFDYGKDVGRDIHSKGYKFRFTNDPTVTLSKVAYKRYVYINDTESLPSTFSSYLASTQTTKDYPNVKAGIKYIWVSKNSDGPWDTIASPFTFYNGLKYTIDAYAGSVTTTLPTSSDRTFIPSFE